MKTSRHEFENSFSDLEVQKRIKSEKRFAIRSAILIGLNIESSIVFGFIIFFVLGCFLISWLPYAFVSMKRAFFNPENASPMETTIPALFAKSSLAWSALIAIFGDRSIRKTIASNSDRRNYRFSSYSTYRQKKSVPLRQSR